jgi:hypothetical protein
MTELKMANAIDNPKKPVVSLVMESAPKDWASDELRSFCSFEADLSCDISDFAALGDTAWENPSPDMIIELKKLLQPMILILEDLRYEMYMY